VNEHQVTPLELFFDLVFVFAITQVTTLMIHEPSWHGVFRGMLVLAAVWSAWTAYSWLTSAIDVDEGAVRLVMLTSMGAMLGVALAEPRAFGRDAVLFGVMYLVVRLLHVALVTVVSRAQPERRSSVLRFAPTALAAATLLLAAGFADGNTRIALWVVAIAVDYLGPSVIGMGSGWHVAPAHFAERYGLIVLIALGESIIAIGVGSEADPTFGRGVAAARGVIVVSALWWLYFDVAVIIARRQLVAASGLRQAWLALYGYSYLHLPMIAGIVLLAFGLRTTLHDVNADLATVAAFALCGGAALYFLGHVAFLYKVTHYVFRRRTIAGVILLALTPVATTIPALAALALVTAVSVSVVTYEAISHREQRLALRHPDPAS
jgi:low temperature requirement protein LtrA